MSNFTKKQKQDIIERMRSRIEEDTEKQEAFWKDEYPKLPIEERQKIWLRKIWQKMRWQGESTGEDLSYFSENVYMSWKKIDKDIDLILDYVIKEIDLMYYGDGSIAYKIDEKLKRK
jgi:hypothetical protein